MTAACKVMLRRYKSEGWVAIVTHNGADECGPFHAWYAHGRPSRRQAKRAGRDLARLRTRLPEHLRGKSIRCNCGWGGTHDPDNPRCDRNEHLRGEV